MKGKNVAKYLFMGIGILILLGAIVTAFVFNFNLGVIVSALYAVLLIVYGIIFNRIKKRSPLHICVIASLIIIVGFGTFLGAYGSKNTATYNEDIVIVLGSGVKGEMVTPNLAHRLDKAVEYHKQNPDAVIIVSGGKGSQENISEAEAMKRYLISEGVMPEMIIMEDKSTSTHENFVFSGDIISQRFDADCSIAFITNSFHVYRAQKYSEVLETEVTHVGADIEWYSIPSNYMRETLAVIKLWTLG